MNLFTSDLDRTLIFSERTVNTAPEKRICIEWFEGREQSFMTPAAIADLKELQKTTHFIPVTTRSLIQYNRITLFQQEILPKYVVVANGGIILQDGKLDLAWDADLRGRIQQQALAFDELPKRFATELSKPYFLRTHKVENLFYMFALDEATIDVEEIQLLHTALLSEGRESYVHGRKFYVLPQVLTKGAAVDYVKGKLQFDKHYAAGDSLMDLTMLYNANRSFVPLHGEIVRYPDSYKELEIIKKSGAAFAEHCLIEILHNK